MKKLFVFGAIFLFVLSVVLNGCTTGKAAGEINANACNADEKCEANEVVSNGAIRMVNSQWYVYSDGWIGAKNFIKVGDFEGYPNGDGSLTAAGDIRAKKAVFAEAFVSADDYVSAKNYLIVGSGNPYPGQGGIAATGDINTKKAVHADEFVAAKDYLSADNYLVVGDPQSYPGRGGILANGKIGSNQLKGNGNAYVCVDVNGYLFRSKTACTTQQIPVP